EPHDGRHGPKYLAVTCRHYSLVLGVVKKHPCRPCEQIFARHESLRRRRPAEACQHQTPARVTGVSGRGRRKSTLAQPFLEPHSIIELDSSRVRGEHALMNPIVALHEAMHDLSPDATTM